MNLAKISEGRVNGLKLPQEFSSGEGSYLLKGNSDLVLLVAELVQEAVTGGYDVELNTLPVYILTSREPQFGDLTKENYYDLHVGDSYKIGRVVVLLEDTYAITKSPLSFLNCEIVGWRARVSTEGLVKIGDIVKRTVEPLEKGLFHNSIDITN